MSDEQDGAEQFDEELLGTDDPVTSDEARGEFPPDHLSGVPFADSDVTDESVAERSSQEEPEQAELLRDKD
ncbi:MAG: hypothetical protein ABI894_13665 [Ilumatobacteraceae bacterium]